MHYNDWKSSGKLGIKLDYTYYNKSHKLMTQFNEFNKLTDENLKTEVHHLRDTEEQRNYNDTHYEFWGFNQDGTFEYGKYVIFVTHDEHVKIHSDSDETREKKRLSQIKRYESLEEREKVSKLQKGKIVSDETKQKISKANKGKHRSDETKEKLREKCSGWHHTDEAKQKISDAGKGRVFSEERCNNISIALKEKYSTGWNPNAGRVCSDDTKKKISDSRKGEKHWFFGKHLSEEHRHSIKDSWTDERRNQQSIILRNRNINTFISEETRKSMRENRHMMSILYSRYKQLGGLIKWNNFNKFFNEIYDSSTDAFDMEFSV